MYTVTQRAETVKQPWGGYIPVKWMHVTQFDDNRMLNEGENISPGLVGTAIDYMTRYLLGAPLDEAFAISLIGASNIDEKEKAECLLSQIHGVDSESITCACKLVGYDSCYRVGPSRFKPVEGINPDNQTMENIAIMLDRTQRFWELQGPVVKIGFDLKGAYTPIIGRGDGDYLTKDTLWDLKVSKKQIKSLHTLQIRIYYIMGKHSVYSEFKGLKKLGIFNPRLNKMYTISENEIPQCILDEVSHDVIGYNLSEEEIAEFNRKMKEEELQNLRLTFQENEKDWEKKLGRPLLPNEKKQFEEQAEKIIKWLFEGRA